MILKLNFVLIFRALTKRLWQEIQWTNLGNGQGFDQPEGEGFNLTWGA